MKDNGFFNKLSVRLTAAFLLASIVGVVVVAVFAYQATTSNFQSYISDVESMQKMMGGMMNDMMGGMASEPAIDFLDNLVRTLWLAGIMGVVLALVLGGVFTRYIVAPLGKVSSAARKVARGDFLSRVKVQGSSELIELGDAFNTMAESLERDQEVRQDIIADIAHELRTPLSVLRANIEAMQDGVLETSSENLDSIHQETLTLARLVEDLRTLSLAESGQLQFSLSSTSMNELLQRVVDGMRTQFDAKNVNLILEIPDGPVNVTADAERTEQVLRNLLTNALHYTPENGKVTVRLSLDIDNIVTSVTDTGIGIPPEDLPRLFERFYRVDQSRTRSTGGSGIGLAIVKKLVEAQGGKVGASSEPNRGSTFWFSLPYETNPVKS